MIAAVFAAKNGNRVVLLEKNEKLGKKVYITGKGRCNLSNDCPPEEFLENVVSNPKFLAGAIRAFSPDAARAFFEELGLSLKTERGGRVFPQSDKASDVTKTLTKELQKRGAEIALSERVLQLIKEDERFCVVTDRRRIGCDSAICLPMGFCSRTASIPLRHVLVLCDKPPVAVSLSFCNGRFLFLLRTARNGPKPTNDRPKAGVFTRFFAGSAWFRFRFSRGSATFPQ